MNLMSLTAVELGKKIKSGEVTAVDATKAALEQIKKLDGSPVSAPAAASRIVNVFRASPPA